MTSRTDEPGHLPCTLCDLRGVFITPLGMLCEAHSLETLANRPQETPWLPIRVKSTPAEAKKAIRKRRSLASG